MYSANERILATHGRTFHFAARFLPPGVRPSVVTLYAFFRTLDDLVDEPETGRGLDLVDEPETGRGRQDVYAELHAWRNWLVENHSRPAPRELLGADVAALITGHQLPIPLFLDFLDGVLGDLEPRQVRDVGELHRYCYAVAG